MTCRIHTEKRHPSCCKWCRADTSGRIPLAPSEIARQGQIVLGLELVSAEPSVEDLKSRRSRRKRNFAMAALVLIACGLLLALPAGAQSLGAVVRSSFGGEGGQ